MSEQSPEHTPYRMQTELIPAGVDLELAGQRSDLIEAFRRGQLEAAEAYRQLEHLYWRNQQTANSETCFYLRETAYAFPVEAGLSMDESEEIYLEVQAEY